MTIGISVVIPTHRRPDKIVRCLEALVAQNYPSRDFEVIVVEDGGADASLDEVRSRSNGEVEVIWKSQPHAGPAAARNNGALQATREFVAFTDDDCQPRPDWLAAIARRLEANPDAVIGGHTVNALSENLYSQASQMLVTFITEYGLKRGAPFFASNNIAVSRGTFERLGGFDDSFPLAGGEDRDFCDRCLELGLDLIHAPEALVDHLHQLTFTTFWRQHFSYGRGAFRFHRARADRANRPGRDPAMAHPKVFEARFYRDLVLHPLRGGVDSNKLITALLLSFSQIPNALGFFAEKYRGPRARGRSSASHDRQEPTP